MDGLAGELLARIPDRPVRLVYGVASGDNTVAVRGVATPVELPTLTPVKSGDYCAVLESGADRLILGQVGLASNYTTVTPATNFDVTLNLARRGHHATISISVTRLTSNVAAQTALVATVGSGGRGSFSTFTQPLPMRSTSDSAQRDALCWFAASTGQVTINWPATWNVGQSMIFAGTVLLF